jgi:choline dehydrogenase-like flavoprotein
VADENRVVVIGSGPPGATAALFLARAGLDVLVLEAGSADGASGLTLRLRGITVAKRRSQLSERAGVVKTGDPSAQLFEELAPGGLSNHWSCAVPRFAVEDFEDALRAGREQTWPVTYEDLAPWYARVEPLLHIAGAAAGSEQLPAGAVRSVRRLTSEWETVGELARQLGRTVAPMPYAYGADTTLARGGTPFNSFVRLLEPELRQNRLAVRFGARVSRLEWSPSLRRVTAVTFRDRVSGSEEHVPCRAVVVAAGALNTPQILLQSKSADFPHGLGNTHDVLGRYLHDHPVGKLVLDLNRPVAVQPAAYITRLELSRSTVPLYAAAGMQWGSSSDLAKSVLRGHPGRLRNIGFSVFGTMAPSRNDYVAVDTSYRGADGSYGLELNITHPPEARTVLDRTRDQIIQLLSRAGWEPNARVWKIENAGSANHYAGSCRMHESPEFGVLDGWSRMHQVGNVVVADSSAFTTGPEKNPVLTSMTLAARASERLAEEIRSGDL